MALLTVRPAAAFTLSDWLFLLALVLTALAAMRSRKTVGFHVPLAVICGAVLFAVGGLISSSQAVQPVSSAAVVARILYITIPWFWLGTVLLRTPGHVRRAVNAWVVSVSICGAGAVAQLFDNEIIPDGGVYHGRATGFTVHPNELGGLAAVAFVPALMLAVNARGYMRAVNWSAAIFVGAGLLLSGSVGALLAAVVSTGVWIVASRRAVPTVAFLTALVLGGTVLLGTTGTDVASPGERFARVTEADVPRRTGGTLHSRIDVYRAAWDQIATQPFVGVGLDEESSNRRLEHQVHNILLLPWFAAGLLGMLGILVLLTSVIVAGLRVIGSVRTTDDRNLAISLYAGFIAFVVFAMSEPVLFVRFGWAPAAFLIAFWAQRRRSQPVADHAVRSFQRRNR